MPGGSRRGAVLAKRNDGLQHQMGVDLTPSETRRIAPGLRHVVRTQGLDALHGHDALADMKLSAYIRREEVRRIGPETQLKKMAQGMLQSFYGTNALLGIDSPLQRAALRGVARRACCRRDAEHEHGEKYGDCRDVTGTI
jgi:hypothetical protein